MPQTQPGPQDARPPVKPTPDYLIVSEEIMDYRVDPVSMREAVDLITSRAAGPPGAYVFLTNVHTTTEAQKSEELRAAGRACFLAVPDGMPLVWILHRRGYPNTEKVTGIELIPEVARRGLHQGLRHFFFGGAAHVAEDAAARLTRIVPGTQIAGCMSPPYDPDGSWDIGPLNDALERSRADLLWVGVGAPKQELWMARHAGEISVPIMVGVGAAFDFLSGNKRAAPRLMSRMGLEWLFRLASEPRRLWRRYLLGNTLFIARLIWRRFRTGS